jgi:hypothetical protein
MLTVIAKRDSIANPRITPIRAIHHIAEHGRDIRHTLERSEGHLRELAKEQRETNQLLELIRNESRLR